MSPCLVSRASALRSLSTASHSPQPKLKLSRQRLDLTAIERDRAGLQAAARAAGANRQRERPTPTRPDTVQRRSLDLEVQLAGHARAQARQLGQPGCEGARVL